MMQKMNESNETCIRLTLKETFKMKKYMVYVIAMVFLSIHKDSNRRLIVGAMKWDGMNEITNHSPLSIVNERKDERNQINQKTKKQKQKQTRTNTKTIGSKFKFRFGFPTEDDVREFFSTNIRMRINHDFAGITNPWLHSQTNNQCQIEKSSNCHSHLKEEQMEDLWIPDGINKYQTDQNTQNPNQIKKNNSPPLRILRYRRKVGYGDKCYLKLRDAALQWEHLHKGSSWAAIKCQISNRNKKFLQTNPDYDNHAVEDPYAALPSDISGNVMQIWSDPGQRKLVTMARVGGKFPIWNLNPCAVMYDLVDCKEKDMTYTSTAYSTLQGHLLAGEERVTVAIRDGGRISNPRLNDIFFISNNNNNNNNKSTRMARTSLDSFLPHSPSNDGDVYVEVLSCSRPSSSILGRMIFPFVKNMQERFFQEQIDTLEKIASMDD